jgi:hypothetical protein
MKELPYRKQVNWTSIVIIITEKLQNGPRSVYGTKVAKHRVPVIYTSYVSL